MTVVPQQAETEIVTGAISGIIQKGVDKWQVAVKADPTSQYSRNLWTKDGELVNQLAGMIGQTFSFMCGISHWTNQQGQPVRSLWINGVAPPQPGQVPQPQPMQQQPQQQWGQQPGTQAVAQAMQPQTGFQQPPQTALPLPQAPTYDDDPKQGKIHRQTASKVAAILLGYLPAEERTLDTLLTVSDRLVGYYDNGTEPTPEASDSGEFPPGW